MDYHAMQEQRARRATLPGRLRDAAAAAPEPPGRELLLEAAETVEQLQAALAQARKDLVEEEREAGREIRAAVAEARWCERNDADGATHGSY